ncbi:MAG: hypothetical protein R8M45_06035, partial [Ghiorsea sp.]
KSIQEQMREIEGELAGYGDALTNKKRFLVLNKMDAADETLRELILDEVKAFDLPMYHVSSVSGEGVLPLLRDIYAEVVKIRAYELEHADEMEKPVTTRLSVPEPVPFEDIDEESY